MQAAPSAPSVLLTADDYFLMPDTGPRYQLIEGELIMAPAPNRFHQDISRNLEFILLKYLEKNPIGTLYDAPFDVVLNEINVFQPDILFVANEQKFIFTKQGVEGAPNLVVEILSDSTARLDKIAKKKVYTDTGVAELWMINPATETIEIYFLQKDAERPAATHQAKDVFSSPTFPGLKIKAAKIFQQ